MVYRFGSNPQKVIFQAGPYHCFINDKCRYSFPSVNFLANKPNLYIQFQTDTQLLLFLFPNMDSDLDVFRKLKSKKYRYKEYITTIVNVLFLVNLNNMC